MKEIFKRPDSLTDKEFTFCAGCQHGVVTRIVAEAIDKLGIQNRTILVASVGCSIFSYDFFDVDSLLPPHGRGAAAATGAKREKPDCIVFTYQGDGDLAGIGFLETLHAARRGENITIIFVNNAIYGMTGGQMAPTTLPGQKTTTTPDGMDPLVYGDPLPVCEVLNVLKGPAYLARVALTNVKQIIAATTAVERAFQAQIEKKGFSLVEILSACPLGWNLTPKESLEWIEGSMIPYFPLGEFRTPFDPIKALQVRENEDA